MITLSTRVYIVNIIIGSIIIITVNILLGLLLFARSAAILLFLFLPSTGTTDTHPAVAPGAESAVFIIKPVAGLHHHTAIPILLRILLLLDLIRLLLKPLPGVGEDG